MIDVSKYKQELYCDNCPEQERCKQKQEQHPLNYLVEIVRRYDEQLYKNIKERLVLPTRCDLVLEKQLQALKQENEELKSRVREYVNNNIQDSNYSYSLKLLEILEGEI